MSDAGLAFSARGMLGDSVERAYRILL